jgi:hypothetical protein
MDDLFELPYKCNHPFENITITNIMYNGIIKGFTICFYCGKCNMGFNKYIGGE